MRRKRRIVSKDGLIVTELQDLTGLSDEEWRALGPSPGGFEWYLHDAERIWRPHAPPLRTVPEKGSLACYAEQILNWINYIRHMRQRGEIDNVGRAALQLGRLHEHAFWRHNLGDDMRVGRRRRRQHQKAGRISAQKRGEQTRSVVKAHAETLRRTHPYSREHSTRWLAGEIARKLRRPVGSVRDALAKLHCR